MSTSSKPDSCAWLMPILTVKAVMASLDFYEKAFGFQRGVTIPDEHGTISYADMLYKGVQVVMMMPEGVWGGQSRTPASSAMESPVNLFVYCDNVDELCAQARQANAEIVSEPEDMFWGDRTCCIKDPDGHTWTFATHIADVDVEKMATK
jgi:uncharacterized glyoxalase superfamily protein PhnB